MLEKIGPIKNPLTIIAIFAGIIEISGTLFLPFLADENQALYVWFLMLFPALLILVFFVTLNFNHTVLYAPSDFKDENNFNNPFKRATSTEKALKRQVEMLEEQIAIKNIKEKISPPENLVIESSSTESLSLETPSQNTAVFSTESRHILIEDLVFRKLASEFGSQIRRGVQGANIQNPYIFDGIVVEGLNMTAIEVKYSRQGFMPLDNLRAMLARIESNMGAFHKYENYQLRLLLVFVSDELDCDKEKFAAEINSIAKGLPHPIEIRFYTENELIT